MSRRNNKKNFIIAGLPVLLALLFVLPCIRSAARAAGSGGLSGDVDGDGSVTSADARLVLRCAIALDTFTGEQKLAGDIDGDGNVTASDARLVLRIAIGLSVSDDGNTSASTATAGTTDTGTTDAVLSTLVRGLIREGDPEVLSAMQAIADNRAGAGDLALIAGKLSGSGSFSAEMITQAVKAIVLPSPSAVTTAATTAKGTAQSTAAETGTTAKTEISTVPDSTKSSTTKSASATTKSAATTTMSAEDTTTTAASAAHTTARTAETSTTAQADEDTVLLSDIRAMLASGDSGTVSLLKDIASGHFSYDEVDTIAARLTHPDFYTSDQIVAAVKSVVGQVTTTATATEKTTVVTAEQTSAEDTQSEEETQTAKPVTTTIKATTTKQTTTTEYSEPDESTEAGGDTTEEKTTAVTTTTRPSSSAVCVIDLTGDTCPADLDSESFVKKAYEFMYIFTMGSFDSGTQIDENGDIFPLTQFIIDHLLYSGSLDIPKADEHKYASVTPAQMNGAFSSLFSFTAPDLTKSDLYNATDSIYEIYITGNSSAKLYAKALISADPDGGYTLTVTFYSDPEMTKVKSNVSRTGVCTMGLTKKNGKWLIDSVEMPKPE